MLPKRATTTAKIHWSGESAASVHQKASQSLCCHLHCCKTWQYLSKDWTLDSEGLAMAHRPLHVANLPKQLSVCGCCSVFLSGWTPYQRCGRLLPSHHSSMSSARWRKQSASFHPGLFSSAALFLHQHLARLSHGRSKNSTGLGQEQKCWQRQTSSCRQTAGWCAGSASLALAFYTPCYPPKPGLQLAAKPLQGIRMNWQCLARTTWAAPANPTKDQWLCWSLLWPLQVGQKGLPNWRHPRRLSHVARELRFAGLASRTSPSSLVDTAKSSCGLGASDSQSRGVWLPTFLRMQTPASTRQVCFKFKDSTIRTIDWK